MNVFELMATLSLDTGEYESKLTQAEGQGQEATSSIGSKVLGIGKTVGKALVGATAAAAGAVATVTGMAVKSYAEYEQLVGGVETLFQGASGKVQEFASNAYKTAGMSANEYMNTVTSFSASLISSLGGDTEKAAEQANKAIVDMSDNANKMGSSMESIQNAYQGFAKQNYTMLDNLKLGYGGTKEEMQRLLDDAEKLSGIKYDISSYSDIVDAIHVVQTEMGITGTTSKEAAVTIEGSLNSMKAAWQNVVVGFAGGGESMDVLLTNLASTAMDFGSNVIPRVQATFEGLGSAIQKAAPRIVSAIPGLFAQILPGFISSTTSLVTSVGQTAASLISTNLPSMLSGAMNGLTQLTEIGASMITSIGEGLVNGIPTLLSNALPLVLSFSENLRANAGTLIDAGLSFITNLAQGLINSLPTLIAYVPQIITNIAGIINDNAPKVLMTGAKIILNLAKGLIQAIPTLIANIPNIIQAIVAVFTAFNWLNLGKNIITALKNGIENMKGAVASSASNVKESVVNAIKELPSKLLTFAKNAMSDFKGAISSAVSGIRSAAASILTNIISAITSLPSKVIAIAKNAVTGIRTAFTSGSWSSVGSNIIKGIVGGLASGLSSVVNKAKDIAKSALNAAKSALGIHSPSRVFREEVGKMIPYGMAEGVEQGSEKSEEAVEKASNKLVKKIKPITIPVTTVQSVNPFASGFYNRNNEYIQTIIQLLDTYLPGMSKLQVVTDTGALIGEIVNPLDEALGELNYAKGRGR